MARTLRIVTLVELENDANPTDVSDWISGHLDNISYEFLEDMGIDPNDVSIGISFPEGYDA